MPILIGYRDELMGWYQATMCKGVGTLSVRDSQECCADRKP